MKNKREKIIPASIKFIKTPASIIILCCQAGLWYKLCFSSHVFIFLDDSQNNLTKPHNGSQLRE